MMIQGAPPQAIEYHGRALETFIECFNKIRAELDIREKPGDWHVVDSWFPGCAVEWSRDKSSHSFGGIAHPNIDHHFWGEAIWVRMSFTDPTGVLVYLPFLADYSRNPLVLTTGNPPAFWTKTILDTYINNIAEKCLILLPW